jgi:hypothetical protein
VPIKQLRARSTVVSLEEISTVGLQGGLLLLIVGAFAMLGVTMIFLVACERKIHRREDSPEIGQATGNRIQLERSQVSMT